MKHFYYSIELSCILLFLLSCNNKDNYENATYLPPVVENVTPFINYATADIRISAKAQTVEILTFTNAKWTAHSICSNAEEEWIKSTRLLTEGEYMIMQFEVSENKGDSSRKGNIYLELQERQSRWWYWDEKSMPDFVITQVAVEP